MKNVRLARDQGSNNRLTIKEREIALQLGTLHICCYSQSLREALRGIFGDTHTQQLAITRVRCLPIIPFRRILRVGEGIVVCLQRFADDLFNDDNNNQECKYSVDARG
jgi:hypothetical protein